MLGLEGTFAPLVCPRTSMGENIADSYRKDRQACTSKTIGVSQDLDGGKYCRQLQKRSASLHF